MVAARKYLSDDCPTRTKQPRPPRPAGETADRLRSTAAALIEGEVRMNVITEARARQAATKTAPDFDAIVIRRGGVGFFINSTGSANSA